VGWPYMAAIDNFTEKNGRGPSTFEEKKTCYPALVSERCRPKKKTGKLGRGSVTKPAVSRNARARTPPSFIDSRLAPSGKLVPWDVLRQPSFPGLAYFDSDEGQANDHPQRHPTSPKPFACLAGCGIAISSPGLWDRVRKDCRAWVEPDPFSPSRTAANFPGFMLTGKKAPWKNAETRRSTLP